ncbi:hypothetical protein ACP0HM_06865 [Escherichia coli]
MKAKNGYKYASLPASEKKRIFEMQQIEQRDKNSKSVMKMLFFRCRTDPLQCQITAVKKFEEARQ